MPATCEVMSTPCEEISVPIEVQLLDPFSARAASDVTVAGGGTCDDMILLIMFGLNEKLNQARPARRRPAIRPVMMKRLLMGVSRGVLAEGIAEDVGLRCTAYQRLGQSAKTVWLPCIAIYRHCAGFVMRS